MKKKIIEIKYSSKDTEAANGRRPRFSSDPDDLHFLGYTPEQVEKMYDAAKPKFSNRDWGKCIVFGTRGEIPESQGGLSADWFIYDEVGQWHKPKQ